jgi:hypothetical protein
MICSLPLLPRTAAASLTGIIPEKIRDRRKEDGDEFEGRLGKG